MNISTIHQPVINPKNAVMIMSGMRSKVIRTHLCRNVEYHDKRKKNTGFCIKKHENEGVMGLESHTIINNISMHYPGS